MGTKHPNPAIPEMKMTKEAIDLAKCLNVFDKQVFFNFGWVPYNQRGSFLLDADVGISCHFDNLETRFSFRTRMLDYLWAELPIISTKGDFFAKLIEEKNLGKSVPAENCEALAETIMQFRKSPEILKGIKKNISLMKHEYSWNNVTQVLNNYICELAKEKKKRLSFRDIGCIAKYVIQAKPGRRLARMLQSKMYKLISLGYVKKKLA